MAYITLNKNHFFYNLDIIAKQTKSKDKIALVLKDNAYGHGLLEMAGLAQEWGITKAVVQSDAEAHAITPYFQYILVLADTPQKFSEKIRYTINELNAIEKFPRGTLVELKVNTGMNRNGIEMDELESALEKIEQQGLILEGMLTHHGCADELGDVYQQQKDNFAKIKAKAPQGLRFHSCNSAALFRDDDFNEDMARVGIAAYGCMDLPEEIKSVELKPVLSVFADRLSSRVLPKGSCIGYGGTACLEQESVVSNYNFGYGDGFLRICSGVFTTFEGVKIAGRISMDNSSFFSDKERLCIFKDARDVSSTAQTISYEVLTSLKPGLKREIV
ncbi:MAG: alanine racemase [Campylobacterales bacterium]|nr:alanine racemase [Campylobacterales bacterium]